MGLFKQFLMEIKTDVKYEGNWAVHFADGSIKTNLHIDSDTNDVYVNSKQEEIMSHDYQIQMNKEKSEKYNVFMFSFIDEDGNYDITHKGGTYKYTLFGAIEKIFDDIVNMLPDDSVVVFWANTSEQSRVKLYDRLLSKVKTKYPHVLHDSFVKSFIKAKQNRKYYGFCKDKNVYNEIKQDNAFWVKLLKKIGK